MTKKVVVYFVRHGVTDSLEKGIIQNDNDSINETGRCQAKKLKEILNSYLIDIVVSSPHRRAVETAKFIRDKISINQLFMEVKKPREVVGKKKNKETMRIKEITYQGHLNDPDWHYSDEENFRDLTVRGTKVLDFLKSQRGKKVVVVSHSNFMTLLFGLIVFEQDFSMDTFLKFKKIVNLYPAGISMFICDSKGWKLQYWNSTSHLLDN